MSRIEAKVVMRLIVWSPFRVSYCWKNVIARNKPFIEVSNWKRSGSSRSSSVVSIDTGMPVSEADTEVHAVDQSLGNSVVFVDEIELEPRHIGVPVHERGPPLPAHVY